MSTNWNPSKSAPIPLEVKDDLLERANGKCEECGKMGPLEPHHLTYIKNGKPINGKEEAEDLIALCRNCHQKKHKDVNGVFCGNPDKNERTNPFEPSAKKVYFKDAFGPRVIVGKFFHTFDDEKKVQWQGIVRGQLTETLFLVQTFEWAMGEPWSQHLINIKEMESWYFYDTASEMDFSYTHGAVSNKRHK